jgi:hypothetical protein
LAAPVWCGLFLFGLCWAPANKQRPGPAADTQIRVDIRILAAGMIRIVGVDGRLGTSQCPDPVGGSRMIAFGQKNPADAFANQGFEVLGSAYAA